jgi:hypothetical protein
MTQLATPKPAQPSFDFDFDITEAGDGDSNDIWDDPKTFKPKVVNSTSKPPGASRKLEPKNKSLQPRSSNFTVKDFASKCQSSKLSISKTSNDGARTNLILTLSQSPTKAFAFDTNLPLPDEDLDVPKNRTPVETIVLLSQSPSISTGIKIYGPLFGPKLIT